jgi:hypothetical protein
MASNDSEVLQGSKNFFGPRNSDYDWPADVSNPTRYLVVPLVTTAGSAALHPSLASYLTDASVPTIPARSLIKACHIYVEDAFTSTATATGIDVGLKSAVDGTTEIDNNGLIAVGGVGAKANLTAGRWDAGDGALIGNESHASLAAYVYAAWAAGTDTLTGNAVVLVEYVPKLTNVLADAT